MKKIIGLMIALIFSGLILNQVQYVQAKTHASENETEIEKEESFVPPLTSPCKPGWGIGDKNHCHSGPPGLTLHQSSSSAEKNEE